MGGARGRRFMIQIFFIRADVLPAPFQAFNTMCETYLSNKLVMLSEHI